MTLAYGLSRKYDESSLSAALAACRAGMSFGRAEKEFGVPKTTLYLKLNGILPESCSKSGPPPVLGIAVEEKLVKHIDLHARHGFPLKKCDVLNLVVTVIKEESLPNPFPRDRPGETWMRNFLHRHPHLSFKRKSCEGKLGSWFNTLQQCLTELGQIKLLKCPERILYADEAVFQLDEDQVHLLTGFSASGALLPTMVVLNEEQIALAEGFFSAKFSDGVTSQSLLFYLKAIAKHLLDKGILSQDGSQKVIIFVETLKRHVSLEVTYFCEKVGIVLFHFFPALALILDAQVLKQVQNAWIQILGALEAGDTGISVATFCKAIPPAFLIEKEKIQKVFEVTGILPFSPKKAKDTLRLLKKEEVESSDDDATTGGVVENGDHPEYEETSTVNSAPGVQQEHLNKLTTQNSENENQKDQLDITEFILESEMGSLPISEIFYDTLIASDPTLTIEVFCTEGVQIPSTPDLEESATSVSTSVASKLLNDVQVTASQHGEKMKSAVLDVVENQPLLPVSVLCVQELQAKATEDPVEIKLEPLEIDEELEVISHRHQCDGFEFVSVKREHDDSEQSEVGPEDQETVSPLNRTEQKQPAGRDGKRRNDSTGYRNMDLTNATCGLCSAPIVTIIELVQHFTSRHVLSFTCQQCQTSILTLDQLLLHLETQHSDNNDANNAIKYAMAHINFDRKLVRYLSHLEKKEQEHLCLICDQVFPVVAQLWQHLCHKHNYCVSCCTFLKNKAAYQQHKNCHSTGDIKFYKCTSCCVEFGTLSAVEWHAQVYHKVGPFQYSRTVKANLSFSTSSDSFCPYCGLTSRSRDILQRHITEHRLLQCGKCKLAFVHVCAASWQCTLCLLSSESAPEDEDCEICPLHQRIEFTARDHQRNQEQVTEIPCIFCHNFKGTTLEVYEHTENIHHCCRVCVLQFETAADLQMHHSNLEHIVSGCNRCFSSQKQLRTAKRCPALSKESLISNRQCPYCCVLIPRHVTLVSHMNVTHNTNATCENCDVRLVDGGNCSSGKTTAVRSQLLLHQGQVAPR
ncbi:hypothetical protein B566_EDAN011767 [Ephemera danica]|nr:hypothetical protein B566_EDAN011767 [Ephemera danica]